MLRYPRTWAAKRRPDGLRVVGFLGVVAGPQSLEGVSHGGTVVHRDGTFDEIAIGDTPMRIRPKPIGSYAWYLRPFFWNQRRKYGRILDAALLWARSPRLFLGVAILYGMIDRRRSPIEPALRSLVTVRVSQINGCAFCVDLNSATLMKRGASMEKIGALSTWRSSALFSARERAALDYAEAVTRSDVQVDEGQFERLRVHFDDDAIVELTGLIAFQYLSSKFNSALGVPPQGFCSLPVALDSAPSAEAAHEDDRIAGR